MIEDTVETMEMHLSRAGAMRAEILPFVHTLSPQDLADINKLKVIDAFLFRFIKIQDLMGSKFFREVLDAVGEYDDSMSMLDVLDRLEKLKMIENADRWLDYRNLRNLLTHEYPDNQDDIVEGIKAAAVAFVEMENSFRHIVRYLRERRR